jgi:hypothetical protein
MGTHVSISGRGHQIDVQHDGGDLTYVIEKAQKLWDDTVQPEETGGASYGFQGERQHNSNGWRLGQGDQPAVK